MTELANLLTGAVARQALAHRDITAVFRMAMTALLGPRMSKLRGPTSTGLKIE
jgi:hypothetical protein